MILTALDDVRPGTQLGRTVHNKEGHTLLGAGVTLSADYIARLRDLRYWAVWIDDPETADVMPADAVSESTRLETTAAIHQLYVLTSQEVRRLRSESAARVRIALENHTFQQKLQDHPGVLRLLARSGPLVDEVLERAALPGLGAIRSHDTYAADHCLDVAVTAVALGHVLGYDRETLRKLAVGSMLHDIGMIFVDDGILAKPARLTGDELEAMKEHALFGYLFLRDNLRLGVLPAHVAYQHHEHQDGTGYPRGLTGTNRVSQGLDLHVTGRIHPLGEVAALADFQASCAADQPYRPAIPADEVCRMIRASAGRHFNREMAEALLAMLPPFPLGTQVVVTSGRWRDYRGVVTRVRRDAMDFPTVRLLSSPDGGRITPIDVDLWSDAAEIRGFISSAELSTPAGASLARGLW